MATYCWLLLRLWKGCLSGPFASRRGWGIKRAAVMLLFVPLLLASQTTHWVGLLLDEVFFGGFRAVEVRQPVFIVGIPRSGTTLLHRVLAEDTRRFTSFSLWELLFAPSVTQRKLCRAVATVDAWIGGPLRKLVGWGQRIALGRLESIHRVALSDPEEDYLTLLPAFACFLLVLAFPESQTLWQLSRFDDEVDPCERRRIMEFYKSCLQRHLYVRGSDKTLLGKNPSFCSMVGALRETFPDCRVISTVRSPLETVPSLLSSMRVGMLMFNSPGQWRDFRRRLLGMLAHNYEHLAATLSTWPENQHVFIRMAELTSDLRQPVGRLYQRFGLSMSDDFRKCLEAACERARSYRSTHRYTLEEFDLNVRDIGQEFAHAFDHFGFEPAAKS
jgi:hypothetical protein